MWTLPPEPLGPVTAAASPSLPSLRSWKRSQPLAFSRSAAVGGGVGDLGLDEFGGVAFGEGLEGEEHDDGTADDEGGTPDEVGPGAGLEAADEDIDSGESGNENASGCEVSEEGDVGVVSGDDLGAGEDDGGGGHPDEDDEGGDGHDGAGEGA